VNGPAAAALRLAAALARVSAALAGVAVLLCFALVCYSVAMRYFLDDPVTWSDEVTGWLVVAVVMLGVADAQARGEHIGVDLLTDRASPRLRRALGLFGTALVAACAGLIAWQGVEMVQFSAMLDLRSNTLGWAALWPVQALVPLGGALLLAVALAQLVALAAGAPGVGGARDPAKGLE
jgi:TRAP-type C4-dicarboxylate transport system permease small subunit